MPIVTMATGWYLAGNVCYVHPFCVTVSCANKHKPLFLFNQERLTNLDSTVNKVRHTTPKNFMLTQYSLK